MPAMVQTQGLTRRFGKLTAVDHLTLEIGKGEIFGLVGPDGAGKTTTLRLLCGLMDPTEGKAMVAGHDVSHDVDAVKDRIGYMAQRFGLYQDLSVGENMEFYADLFGIMGDERAQLTSSLLKMTRMEPFRDRWAGRLSGGMKQKLALMCTLLHKPDILFLDEPTNGVDPVSRRDFWAILYQLVKDGLTVFITTAYLDEAERCNRVGLMHEGKLIQLDTPTALRKGMSEVCYEISNGDLKPLRERLQKTSGIASAESSGATLHVFADKGVDMKALAAGATAKVIEPSLEDVFIALIRKAERS